MSFAEGVEPFDLVANAAGHLVSLASGASAATDWAIFYVKAQVDMMPKVKQLLLGVQVGILMFFADGATDPRVNRQHFDFLGSLASGSEHVYFDGSWTLLTLINKKVSYRSNTNGR